MRADGPETAAIHAEEVFRLRRIGRWHDEVDRAAKRCRAILKAVAAAINLDMLEDQRIDFLKVAAAIGVIERDAVLQQFDAAQMIATAEARAPYRETPFLTVKIPRENARREGEQHGRASGRERGG